MTIQIPDPGTGVPADKTGDSPWLAMTKVAANFSNQTHAASRLVGTATGQIPLSEQTYKASKSTIAVLGAANADNLLAGTKTLAATSTINNPTPNQEVLIETDAVFSTVLRQFATPYAKTNKLFYRIKYVDWTLWAELYTTSNTTKDSNGFIKAASPIAKVFADKVELNDEAEQQNVTFKKNGVGDYTITTVSGLSTDGWYIELPKDMNGNPKVAVTLKEADGVISLKSYKRVFSMETFTFVPDLNTPLDVPDGRWIDLRLNEVPVEQPEAPLSEV